MLNERKGEACEFQYFFIFIFQKLNLAAQVINAPWDKD